MVSVRLKHLSASWQHLTTVRASGMVDVGTMKWVNVWLQYICKHVYSTGTTRVQTKPLLLHFQNWINNHKNRSCAESEKLSSLAGSSGASNATKALKKRRRLWKPSAYNEFSKHFHQQNSNGKAIYTFLILN